ncbi:hypothetical protein CAPTEDRAFT_213712, partial [Capitella teleta]
MIVEPIIDDLCPPSFTFVGQHRPEEKGTREGGVGIVLKSGLMTKTVVHNYSTFEALTLITTDNNRATITVVYRPPPSSENGFSTTDFLRKVKLLLSELYLDYTSVCVVGDFNVHVDKRHDPTSVAFEQTLQGLSLHQVVSEPTHKHGNILDLVLVQEPERVSSLHVDKHYSISDHCMVTFQLKLILETSERPFLHRRALKHINMADFVLNVTEALSSLASNAPTLDESLIAMNTALLTTLDSHAPLKTVRPKGNVHKGCYDDEVHEERQRRRRLERKFKITELQVQSEMWKDQCTKVVRLIDQKEKSYFQNKLKEASSKEAFTLIDRLLAKDKAMTIPSEKPSVL